MRRGHVFIFTENETMWIHPGLKKIRFSQGRTLKSWLQSKINLKKKKKDMRCVFNCWNTHTHHHHHLWLIYVQCTVIYVTFKSLCIFRVREPDSNENGWYKWSNIQNSCWVRWPSLRLLQLVFDHYPNFLKVPTKIRVPTSSLEWHPHSHKIGYGGLLSFKKGWSHIVIGHSQEKS